MLMCALIVGLLAAAAAGSGTGPDRGFNGNIAWSNRLEDSLARAKSEGRPALVLIHKSWCGACKRLKSVFEHPEIERLAHELVMVNLEDDEEPADPAYRPDGSYIPRIFFVRDGAVLPLHNTAGNPQYKYYYSSEDQIIASMKAALESK